MAPGLRNPPWNIPDMHRNHMDRGPISPETRDPRRSSHGNHEGRTHAVRTDHRIRRGTGPFMNITDTDSFSLKCLKEKDEHTLNQQIDAYMGIVQGFIRYRNVFCMWIWNGNPVSTDIFGYCLD